MSHMDLELYSKFFTDYTELRLQENAEAGVTMVNGDIFRNMRSSQKGASARVYRNGSWGFASDSNSDATSTERCIRKAAENARFLAARKGDGARVLPARPTGTALVERDLRASTERVQQKRLLDFARALDAHCVSTYRDLMSRTVAIGLLDISKDLVTSDGSRYRSVIPRSVVVVSMTKDSPSGPVMSRAVFDGGVCFDELVGDHEALYPRMEETYAHLTAKAEGVYPRAGVCDAILGPDLAGILAHEAIGHTVEADGVLGGSVAGDFLDRPVASELVTLVDFAHTAMGETCPVPVWVDDEGTVARDAVIIEQGILKSFMHNKETALHFGAEPTGNARAWSFSDEPLVRMRNTAILPGVSKLADMIASVDDGYYFMKSGSGQADSTSEFMFGVVQGYEIKKGKLGRALRDTTVSGVAFDMLKTVSAVSDDMAWTCAGMCGKKQPIPVGMGGPALRCKIMVGGR